MDEELMAMIEAYRLRMNDEVLSVFEAHPGLNLLENEDDPLAQQLRDHAEKIRNEVFGGEKWQ